MNRAVLLFPVLFFALPACTDDAPSPPASGFGTYEWKDDKATYRLTVTDGRPEVGVVGYAEIVREHYGAPPVHYVTLSCHNSSSGGFGIGNSEQNQPVVVTEDGERVDDFLALHWRLQEWVGEDTTWTEPDALFASPGYRIGIEKAAECPPHGSGYVVLTTDTPIKSVDSVLSHSAGGNRSEPQRASRVETG